MRVLLNYRRYRPPPYLSNCQSIHFQSILTNKSLGFCLAATMFDQHVPIIITCKRQSGSQLFSLICLLRNGHVGPKLSTFSLLGPLHYPWVLSVVFKCFANIRITDQIAFLCVHAPRGHIYLRFFCVLDLVASYRVPPPRVA